MRLKKQYKDVREDLLLNWIISSRLLWMGYTSSCEAWFNADIDRGSNDYWVINAAFSFRSTTERETYNFVSESR